MNVRRNTSYALTLVWLAVGGWNCDSSSYDDEEQDFAESKIDSAADGEWPAYGRDPGGARHSPLAQITRRNVSRLKQAWTLRTGDLSDGTQHASKSTFQSTPLHVFNTIYTSTGYNRVFALDPENGEVRWTFDPKLNLDTKYFIGLTSRGVAAWADPEAAEDRPCQQRIFLATLDARLISIDAKNGTPCTDFGQGGMVNLAEGISNITPGHYGVTSLPSIVNGVVVVGSLVADDSRVDVPSGIVRAYDVRTGERRWGWDPIPRNASDPGYDAWSPEDAARTQAANVWSVIAVDTDRDLVFLPTSAPAPDYYGGLRKGANPHANSMVALRASTGKFVWAFQTSHHDIFDYDIAAPPALTAIRRHGRSIDAVAVATKQAHVFFLDRETGEPLFPVEERPVPPSDIPGEQAYPTQPFPVATPNLVGDTQITVADAWGLTPRDYAFCVKAIAGLRSDGIFTPPSKRGSIHFPSAFGGTNWGGVAVDENRGILVTAVNRFPQVVRLLPHDEPYQPFPGEEIGEQPGTPYRMGRRLLTGPDMGLPCTKPPWGKLVAVDLKTGGIRWDVPLGRMPGLESIPGSARWGSRTMGGPIVTDGGLVFVGASSDDAVRAFDSSTGRELWRAPLPAGGQATPMTYRSRSGKQFVLIAAGGSIFLDRPPGDYLVAFALP
ncbi:pyrroloquinoline quinone-dependent dehydrogenase [Pendulispora rubella]|uniref:Pyrroloquinoline quinone-dependent dehydrogenase n=1 Tax=Pendulispora rubella TaxID=2741070 RepID=A0ABZ2KX52_9BACT